LLEAKDGTIWIGTNYGLHHLLPDKGMVEVYGKSKGLEGNVICGIAESNNGDIWASTNKGISRIRQSDGKVINYLSGGDWKEMEFRKGMLVKGPEEKIFAAGINGLTAFQPDAIKDHQQLAPPILTGIHLNAKRGDNPSLSYPPTGEKDVSAIIRLAHDQNTFSIELSNFNYRNPGNTEFEYRIPKLQKEWQKNPLGDNRVVCNYLDPGKYILEVRAVENGETSPITTILIDILPPWYLSFWAKLAYIIIFVLTTAAIWYEMRRNRRQRQKEEIAEEQFKMLYNFAHELRSPATLIISPLPSLIREEKDERKVNIFKMIQRNGYRITDLVNKMLDVRRIEKGQLKLSFSETNLQEYLKPIIEDFRLQAEARAITISVTLPDEEVKAYIDQDYFDKVIVNLMSNAIKFTPDGGAIDVVLRRTSAQDGQPIAILEVTDTGNGIQQEDMERIFERFYQGDRKNNGFGIGLNLSKMLVDMHHGKIRATNRNDTNGALFEVTIPLGRSHLKDEEINLDHIRKDTPKYLASSESVISQNEPQDKKVNRTHRVLIADDDDEIREYLQQELGKSYKTVVASDGDEAFAIALEKHIDLVISDIMMPNTDGLSLLKQIRSNADLAHIPIILLTTSEDFNTRMSGWEKGADAYLTKPFHIEELRQLCSSLISGRIRLKGRYSHGERIEENIDKVEIKGNDEILLERIMKAVNENIGNSEFGVEQLAETVGLSRVHLHRKIKTLVGLAPRDFLKGVRLKRAAELLKKNTTTISQVGYTVGFSSPGQFSDSFKKYFGCSPSEYIARETGNNDIEKEKAAEKPPLHII
ncbi:MAG: response regulator, partial [Muribaculaceae bacterium]|nr:response regulator [Muribaculaceae bacterium]